MPAGDPALLDELPVLGDILPSLPPALKARLFAAFDLEILWNKPGGQATVFIEITENTLRAIPGIIDPGQDGYHDTSTNPDDTAQPAPMWDLTNTHRGHTVTFMPYRDSPRRSGGLVAGVSRAARGLARRSARGG